MERYRAKKAIIAFIEKVTKEGSPNFVPGPKRIAVFDNDGTLWTEQPMYFPLFFVIDRIKALAPQHPEWKTKEPFASLRKGDLKAALAGGEHGLLEMVMSTHAGLTTEEFEQAVTDWLATAKHPKTGRPFTEMVYQPMLELLTYLRANGFKTFIVSGGGIEFMRAFGNSDGDSQMLQWTTAGSGPRFAVIVHHTDGAREWAYDRTSHVGKLHKAWDEANAKGWTSTRARNESCSAPPMAMML